MEIEKCPHCFRQVLPTGDRLCPSCSRPLDEPPHDKRANRDLIWLSKSSKLPEICLSCGQHTSETAKLQDFSMSRLQAFANCLFRLRPNLLLAVVSLFRPDLAAAEGYRMLRSVPCCPRCKRENRPKIHKTDHHHFRLGILVDSKIARKIEDLQKSS